MHAMAHTDRQTDRQTDMATLRFNQPSGAVSGKRVGIYGYKNYNEGASNGMFVALMTGGR